MFKIINYKAPSKNGIETYLTTADNSGAYTVASESKGVGYTIKSDEVTIVTTTGCLSMDVESAKRMIFELASILDDVKDLKRMGVAM